MNKEDVVKYAVKCVPFYTERYSEKKKLWEQNPLTMKSDVLDNPDKFFSSYYIMEQIHGKLLKTWTSGSTGKCLQIFWDKSSMVKSLFPLWIKRNRYYGIQPSDKYIRFGTNDKNNQSDVQEGKNSLVFGWEEITEEKLRKYYSIIQQFQPKWMILQPSLAMKFCMMIKKYGLLPIASLVYIEMTGEVLFDSVRRLVKETLQCSVANQYGCYEMNSIAYECPEGKLHCMTENVYVEIVKKGKVLPYGEQGDVIVTSLQNKVMPLIRYKTGDIGILHNNNCSCGMKGDILEINKGRTSDVVRYSDGNEDPCYIFSQVIEYINEEQEGVIYQFQVIQRAENEICIRLVAEEEADREAITESILQNMKLSSKEKVNIQVEFTTELELSGRTGKLSIIEQLV